MKKLALKAKHRDKTGKGPNGRLRNQGYIPAILYAKGEPEMIAIDGHDFQQATAHMGDEMVMFGVTVEDSGVNDQLTIIRDVQRDPVTERILHMDMMRIDMNKPLDVEVGVHPSGVPVGVQEGGVFEQVTRSIYIRCLPSKVPSYLEMDVTGMNVNDSLHVSELEIDPDIEILMPEDEVLFSVVPPRSLEEELPPEEAAEEGAEMPPEIGEEEVESEQEESE